MTLSQSMAEIWIPDGAEESRALARTTHMAIGAHQDDLEIMAYDGIMKCFQQTEYWFCGVVVTNGSGSPAHGPSHDDPGGPQAASANAPSATPVRSRHVEVDDPIPKLQSTKRARPSDLCN